jgi:starch phosphorylase
VIPLYYKRAEGGYSAEWIRIAKRSMASLLPRYDASRMLGEYVSKYYLPASRQGHRYTQERFDAAKSVAAWKARVRAAWPGVALRRLDAPKARIQFGDTLRVEVAAKLNGLEPGDVCVELLLARGLGESPALRHSHELAAGEKLPSGEQKFLLDLKPGMAGRLDYRIRVVPRHELLTHPLELGLCAWL